MPKSSYKLMTIKGFLGLAVLLAIGAGMLITIAFLTSSHISYPISATILVVSIWGVITTLVYIAKLLFKLLELINMNQGLSAESLELLSKIRRGTLVIAIISSGFLLYVYDGTQISDLPEVIIVALGVLFIPFSIFVFVGLIEQLIEHSVAEKGDELDAHEKPQKDSQKDLHHNNRDS